MIKHEMFLRRFRQLVFVTKQYDPKSEISFRSGMWFRDEGYKQELREEALKALDSGSWRRDDCRRIISCVNAAMEVCCNLRSGSLLSTNAFDRSAEAFLINADKIAPVFYDLFQPGNDQDPACFEAVAKCVSGVYDAFSVAAFFMFLKDFDKYSPVRKDADAKRLNQIGGKASCMLKCNWENYMVYMDTIVELRDYLRDYIPDTTLLDAQSFLWMLWKVDNDTPEYEISQDENHFVDEIVLHKGTPLSVSQWEELIHEGFISDEDIRFLAKFYAYPDHAVSCSELGKNEGSYHTAYNKRAKDIGSKVSRRLGLPPMYYEDGVTDLYFPVEFLWKKDQAGRIVWKVRPELASAMEKACPEMLGAGIAEYEAAEQKAIQQASDDEIHARAKASGTYAPVQYISQTTQYRRNGYIAADAKRRAAGKCQLCGKTPFLDRQKNVYLEVHHIDWLSSGGADTLENVVALCPNCHRKMHINPDEDDIRKLKDLAHSFEKD